MNSVSVVVVIVGVVIAAIAAASLSDGPKPPTRSTRAERTPPPPGPDRFVPAFAGMEVGPDAAAAAPVPDAAPAPPSEGPPATGEGALRPRRARALVLLLGSVVVLGAAVAGAIGALVLLGVWLLDRALG